MLPELTMFTIRTHFEPTGHSEQHDGGTESTLKNYFQQSFQECYTL